MILVAEIVVLSLSILDDVFGVVGQMALRPFSFLLGDPVYSILEGLLLLMWLDKYQLVVAVLDDCVRIPIPKSISFRHNLAMQLDGHLHPRLPIMLLLELQHPSEACLKDHNNE